MQDRKTLKKSGEQDTAQRFIENQNLVFQRQLIDLDTEEPADIIYNGIKYQIVTANFGAEKALNIDKQHKEYSPNSDDRIKRFIDDPIQHKNRYGHSAQGHILLIDYRMGDPPININDICQYKKNNNTNWNIGFDKIFFVTQKKNVQIHPNIEWDAKDKKTS